MGEARVLGLPRPSLPRSLEDRERYAASASPESISASLRTARRRAMEAATDVSWLEVLLARRCQQVAAGEWPPKPESDAEVPGA